MRSKLNTNGGAAQQENQDHNGASKAPETDAISEKEIQALTVVKLKEICVLNNLCEVSNKLKKDLVKTVTDFYASF